MSNFVKVEFELNDEQLKDQLVALLAGYNYEGYEETENSLVAYIAEEEFDQPVIENLSEQFQLKAVTTVVEQQNWNALWESNFEPVVVEDFCTIRADFHEPAKDTQHEIIITPKMSFGTGHHATTYLMIKQMRDLDFAGKRVADFGSGTGILAIMAEKLGANEVVAIDYDDWCIENSLENIERNNCSKISVVKADHFSATNVFDIILANINKNVIVDNLQSLAGGLTKGGKLLLSGLLQTDETEVVAAFEQVGMKKIATQERGNWITILLEL